MAWSDAARAAAAEQYARIAASESKGKPVIAVVSRKGLQRASVMKSDMKISTVPVRIHKLLRLKK